MRLLAVLLVGLLTVLPAAAHDEGMPAVDPAAEARLFPDPSEVRAAIDAVADHPWATVHTVGTSLEGVPLRLVEVTDPDGPVPVGERVVTFIMTQQHGNEPAGTPAALRLLAEIDAGGPATGLLGNQVLLLMPQVNPDGAVAEQRANRDGTDINRDHVSLETPEARAVHEVLRRWDVHMAMDHHEYGGVGAGYPVPVRVYDYDVTTMFPNHGNVRAPTAELARELNYDHLYPAVEEDGYSIGDYGWITLNGERVQQTAGGPDPGILRNNYGLNNVVGLLVETFVAPDENPLYSFERRVGAHESVMRAVLEFGHERGADLVAAKRASERLNRDSPLGWYVEGETSAPMPSAYLAADDLRPLWLLHALPEPRSTDGGWLYHADHGRAGLVAALLQPESSRSVADGRPAAATAHPDALHRDYAGPAAEVPEAGPDAGATVPGLPVAALLALLGLVALGRLRRS